MGSPVWVGGMALFSFPSVRVTLAICLNCRSFCRQKKNRFFARRHFSLNCHIVLPQQAPTLAGPGQLQVHAYVKA